MDGDEITFPPSGIVARVSTVESVVGTIDVFPPEIAECDEQRNTNGHRIQVVRRTFGEVIGPVSYTHLVTVPIISNKTSKSSRVSYHGRVAPVSE